MVPCQKIELCIDPLIRRTASPVALAGHVFGTLSQIRTERITAFETADFTNLSNRAYFFYCDKYYEGFIMITITKTRPSVNVPFYFETLSPADREAMALFASTNPMIMELVKSDDGLTRTITFNATADEFTAWNNAYNLVLPALHTGRIEHEKTVGITNTVTL